MARIVYGGNFFSIITKTTSEIIDINDIIYIETTGRKVRMITEGDTYNLLLNIEDIRNVLNTNPDFCICHKTFIINMGKVRKMKDGEIVFVNMDKRYLGRNNFANARKKFNEYVIRNSYKVAEKGVDLSK